MLSHQQLSVLRHLFMGGSRPSRRSVCGLVGGPATLAGHRLVGLVSR
jgi:hypothetical protein